MHVNRVGLSQGRPLQSGKKPAISLIVAPLVVLAILSPWILNVGSPLTTFLVAAQLAICTAGTVRSYSSGTRPTTLIYFVFTFSWLGVGPAYQLSHGQMAWRDYTILANDDLLVRALLLNVLASGAFLAGSEFQRYRRGLHPTPTLGQPAQIRHEGKFLWYYLTAAVLLTPLAIRGAGGIGTMFASRAERSSALANAGLSLAQAGGLQVALVTILPSALSIAGAVLATMNLQARWGTESVRPSDWAAFALAFVLLVLFCNPLANSRFITSLAFGALIIAILRPRSKRAGQRFAVVALLGTAVVYPLAEVFRQGFDATTSLRTGTRAFASMDFDGFQQLANAVVFTDDHGLSRGHYTASALLYFVPRSLWEGKATPASLDVAANRGYSFTNLSLPIPAEMYLEFGMVGMIVVLFALGMFLSKVDQGWLYGGFTKLGATAPVVAVSMLGFVRGPLGSLAPVYLTAIILVYVALGHGKKENAPKNEKAKIRHLQPNF